MTRYPLSSAPLCVSFSASLCFRPFRMLFTACFSHCQQSWVKIPLPPPPRLLLCPTPSVSNTLCPTPSVSNTLCVLHPLCHNTLCVTTPSVFNNLCVQHPMCHNTLCPTACVQQRLCHSTLCVTTPSVQQPLRHLLRCVQCIALR